MAEGKDPSVEKGVKELEEEITCAICHDHYTDPKVLSCCHYYCKQCIYRLALRTGLDRPFSCPECRKNTTLPQGSVDNLQAAFFVNRLKEVHSKLERVTGKVEAKCEMCSGAKAEAFCRQCMMFICAECLRQHQKMKVFAGHKTSSLDELKEGGAKEILTQEPTLQTCKLHDELMKFYCFDCSCLICRDCTVEDHLGHKYKSLKKAAPETKEKLIQHLEPLRERTTNLSCAIKEIQTTKSEVKEQRKSVATSINSSFDQLQQIIERRRKKLLAEAEEKETSKLEHLSGQEKSLSTACAVVQSVIEYTEQCVDHAGDDEILCMHGELLSRIDREIEEQQKEERNLEPVEEADMAVEVSCVEELKQLCQTKAKITQLPIDPTQCTVTLEGAKIAVVGKISESSFVVSKNLSNGRPTNRRCDIECCFKSLANGSTTKCQVNLIKGNEYRIQYTPTVQGRHELTVTLNGQEVAGSPFPVFVSIHPTQLGKPVRVITDLDSPSFVAINAAEETIIVNEKTVSIFDKSGKKLRSRNLSEYSISAPYGMAVDTDGCVYITDGCRKVIKLRPDLQLICQVTLKEGSKAEGVAVVGDEVMVCDLNNCVMVYTKELKYVRQIGSHGDGQGQFKHIRGISSDEGGNLYICDSGKSCVHVFSNGGAFLRSFGQGGDGVEKLICPWGVCVAGQYVFVSEHTGQRLSVFTTEGEHVTTLGQEGSGEGDFSSPIGVCVDKEGFVCVCDYSNKRVQIF